MLHEETIVGFVFVEAADDVIAITPCVRPETICLISVGLSVPYQVEPVPRPLLTVMRIIEQPLNHAPIGPRRRVSNKARDFLRTGRQTEHVEVGATNPRALVGFRRRIQPAGKKFLKNELINGVSRPAAIIHFRNFHRAH